MGEITVSSWIKRIRDSKLAYWVFGYAGVGGLILGWLQPILDWFNAPPVVGRIVVVLLIAGFPVTLILVWYHGEKGYQALTRREVVLLSGVVLLTGLSLFMVSRPGELATEGADAARQSGAQRIAVLVEDRSTEGRFTSTANGVMEHLIHELSRSDAFEVVSANDSRQFVGASLSSDSLARALKVGGVAMGSLSGTDEELSLNVEFVDPVTGVASESHAVGPFPLDDELQIQRRIAEEAAVLIRNGIGLEMLLEAKPDAGIGSDPWNRYWEAKRTFRDFLPTFERGDREVALNTLDRTDQLVERAIAADRGWLAPRLLSAEVAFRRGWVAGVYGDRAEAGSHFRQSLARVDEVLRRQPTQPAAETVRARTLLHAYIFEVSLGAQDRSGLLAEAYDAAQTAADQAPSDAEARHVLGEILIMQGQIVRAQVELEKARESDPYLSRTNQRTVFRLFEAAFHRAQDPEAQRWCLLGNSLYPEDWLFPYCALQLQAWAGLDADPASSQQLVDAIITQYPTQFIASFRPILDLTHAAVLARSGRTSEARLTLDRYENEAEGMWAPWVAGVQALLGEADSALATLEAFASANPEAWRGFPGVQSILRSLVGNPRFDSLIPDGVG